MRWVWLVGLLMVLAMAVMPASAETLKVKIHNPNNYDLVDYQIRIDLSEYLDSVSYLKVTDENGNDLKFCYEQDNGECGVNPSSIIWVKAPKIPAKSDTVIYIEKTEKNYAVNGDQVFDFYDDFNGNSLDINNWVISVKKYSGENEPSGGHCRVSGGYLTLALKYTGEHGISIYTKKCFTLPNLKVLMKWRLESTPEPARISNGFYNDLSSQGVEWNYDIPCKYDDSCPFIGSGPPSWRGWGITGPDGLRARVNCGYDPGSRWHTSVFLIKRDKLVLYVDNNLIGERAVSIPKICASMYIGHWWSKGYIQVDWVSVAKCANQEPTITIEKAQALIPKPKLKLTISCDSTLKQGEIRTAELTIENVGNDNAKDIKVAITSPSLGIDIRKDYDLIPSSEARTITFKITPNEAGKFKINAIAEYWDDQGNKYIETTEKVIEVEQVVVPTSTTPMSASAPKSKPPVAIAGDDVTVYEGSEVTLSALASYDPDGTIVSYQWIDENGVTISNSPILRYSFPVGTHVITLKVTDNDGLSSTDTVKVTVLAKEHGKPSIDISQSTLSGEEGLLTVTIANTGDAKAFDVRVSERIPSEIVVSYVEGATSSGSLITWTGDLDVGEQHNIKHSLKLQTDQAVIPVTVKYKDASGKEYELSTNLIVQKPTQTTPQNKLPISEQTLIILTAIVVVGIVAVAVAIAMMKKKPPKIQIKE